MSMGRLGQALGACTCIALATATLTAVGIGPAVASGGDVTEYTAGFTSSAGISGIALGSDGNMWFTESSADKIGKITTAGDVTEYNLNSLNGLRPKKITAAADGNLWFTEDCGDFDICGDALGLGKITTAGVPTLYPLSEAGGIGGIASANDGSLWIDLTEVPTPYPVFAARVSLASGALTKYSDGLTPAKGTGPMVQGSDGAMWFGETDFGLVRTTLAGSSAEFTRPGHGDQTVLEGIASGSDGNIWGTLNGGSIEKITSTGTMTSYPTPTTNAAPFGIAAGRDGRLWFAESGIDKIGSSSTAGTITEYGTGITSGASPEAIAAGSDGNMWFTEPGTNSIGRINVDQLSAAPTPATAPGRIALSVASKKKGSAALHFSASSNGGSALQRFAYRVAVPKKVAKTKWRFVGAANSSVKLTRLGKKTRYVIQAYAINAVGNGPTTVARFTSK